MCVGGVAFVDAIVAIPPSSSAAPAAVTASAAAPAATVPHEPRLPAHTNSQRDGGRTGKQEDRHVYL